MENYELNIYEPLQYSPVNGRFLPGHKPFNKGVPMSEWMDGRKKRRILKYLEIGRCLGNKHLPGANRKAIVGIKDGKITAFRDALTAERYLRSLGIKVNKRNINTVCHGKDVHRKHAGGYMWFFADETEKYEKYLF